MPYCSVVHGKFRAIGYLIWHGKDAVLIDPPQDTVVFDDFIAEKNLRIRAILCTHLHVDHIVGCGVWQKVTGLPIRASKEDIAALPEMLGRARNYDITIDFFTNMVLKEGIHKIGKIKYSAILVPGHSPGSFCYHFPDEKILVSGDSLFSGVLPRTDFPESIPEMLVPTLREKIFSLPPETTVLPGHGRKSLLGEEVRNEIYASL